MDTRTKQTSPKTLKSKRKSVTKPKPKATTEALLDSNVVVRFFTGDQVEKFTEYALSFRIARVNGIVDTQAIQDCCVTLEIPEAEALELLGSKFAVVLDVAELTLEYTYSPKGNDSTS